MNRPCTCDKPGCQLCWLYNNDPDYRTLWGGLPFVKAVVKHVANRLRTVDEAEYSRRLAVCHGCEFFKDNRCLRCGCKIEGGLLSKARWESETCPEGKW